MIGRAQEPLSHSHRIGFELADGGKLALDEPAGPGGANEPALARLHRHKSIEAIEANGSRLNGGLAKAIGAKGADLMGRGQNRSRQGRQINIADIAIAAGLSPAKAIGLGQQVKALAKDHLVPLFGVAFGRGADGHDRRADLHGDGDLIGLGRDKALQAHGGQIALNGGCPRIIGHAHG